MRVDECGIKNAVSDHEYQELDELLLSIFNFMSNYFKEFDRAHEDHEDIHIISAIRFI